MNLINLLLDIELISNFDYYDICTQKSWGQLYFLRCNS